MRKKTLVLTDLEGALISSKRPEVDGRKYMVVTRNKWDKKVMTYENMDKLKELATVADVVPMTKLSAKRCNSMAFCIDIPMALVESGAVLLKEHKADYKWRMETLQKTYDSYDMYCEGQRFLSGKGYEQNDANEFTLDYVNPDAGDIENDIEKLREIIGNKYNVYQAGPHRIYAYYAELSRRLMVRKFIEMFPYEKVISISAGNTGWLQEKGIKISVEGTGADFVYPKEQYDADLHKFTSFALDAAIGIAKL